VKGQQLWRQRRSRGQHANHQDELLAEERQELQVQLASVIVLSGGGRIELGQWMLRWRRLKDTRRDIVWGFGYIYWVQLGL
jgi:hypothetical protein